MTRNINIY